MSQHGAQGAALQGLTHREIVEFYYPGTTWGTARGKVSVLISADTSKDVQVLASRRAAAPGARQRQGVDLAAARPRRRAGGSRPVSGGRAQVSFRTSSAGRCSARSPGTRRSSPPVRRRRWCCPRGGKVALPRRAALGEEGHRQRAAARQVPPGRRAEGGPGALGARGRAGPGRRRPHLRGVRARAPAGLALPDLRHDLLPGLRRRERRAPGRDRRESAPPAARCCCTTASRRSRQFSASSGGWTSAGSAPYLVAKQDPYDALVGQPAQRLADGGQRRHGGEGVPGHRQPDPDPVLGPGRQRRVGRPGGHRDAHRQRGYHDGLGRGLPLPARAAVGVGQPDRDRRPGRTSELG